MANELAIETPPVGPALRSLLQLRASWQGITKELLIELADHHSDEKTRQRWDWPRKPKAMTTTLRRIAPSLPAECINVTFRHLAGRSKRRVIVLEQTPKRQTTWSASSASGPNGIENADSMRTVFCRHILTVLATRTGVKYDACRPTSEGTR